MIAIKGNAASFQKPSSLQALTDMSALTTDFKGAGFPTWITHFILKTLSAKKDMTEIRFKTEYSTQWGEVVNLCYKTAGRAPQQVAMHTDDGRTWECAIKVAPFTQIEYHYAVVRQDNMEIVRTMRQGVFKLLTGKERRVVTYDQWAANDINDVFLHTAFSQCAFKAGEKGRLPCAPNNGNTLCLHTTPPPAGCSWGVAGGSEALGSWKGSEARRLTQTGPYEFSAMLEEEDLVHGLEYKYVLINDEDASKPCVWETGENRVLSPQKDEGAERMVFNDGGVRIACTPWRGAGVVIPVFSLRSEGSQGIGDFGDLRRFITWASSVRFKCVQILPINDTTSSGTWHDSYPYNGISVFALHPVYLDLREWEDWSRFAFYKKKAEELNRLPKADYEAAFALKMEFLSELYLAFGEEVMETSAFHAFFDSNERWLIPYACYCREKAQRLGYATADDLAFFYFTQFLLHRQMVAAHDTARQCGVILKGDIPIGVCADSVPATIDRQLFHFDGSAGAPPDDFAREGQNWGFPTYNWEMMKEDGYRWWKERLGSMSQYFDAYRIDHVLGFFRIWEIPTCQVQGLMGHFRPALPLDENEIREWGFDADIERYCRPFVTKAEMELLEQQFPHAGLCNFLKQAADGTFELQEHADTQRKIALLDCDEGLKKALMCVAAEVLFIKDPDRKGYHPRILAHETRAFQTLDSHCRQAFKCLYEDFFYRRHNQFWAQKALEKMGEIMVPKGDKIMDSMLPCAEDLGMVPDSVKGVLEQLQILSLEIQRMPKKFGVRFDNLEENPYLSVSTIATHDMPPFRLWWRENREQTQMFYHDVLHREGEAPEDATPEICEQVVSEHLKCPSMLCANSLQDYMAIDGSLRNPYYEEEQINVPSNPNQYWNYRMHLTIEQLVGASSFNEKLRMLIKSSGR